MLAQANGNTGQKKGIYAVSPILTTKVHRMELLNDSILMAPRPVEVNGRMAIETDTLFIFEATTIPIKIILLLMTPGATNSIAKTTGVNSMNAGI